MHGISFGSTNLPYRFGPVNGGSGQQGVARGDYGHDRGSSSISPSRFSQGGILSNLSGSISNLRSQLESLSTSRDLPIDWSGEVSASGMGAQVINKQRGELQIHTQDGDVVTLKFSSKVGVRIEGQQISDGTTTLTDASMDVYSRSKIKMSVEGELSDAELTAINNLVDKVGDLTNEFFNGNMDNVIAQAMSLSYDSSVLADYSLDLSLKQSVRAYTYAVAWVPPKPVETPPVTDEAPATETISDTPAETVTEEATPVETPADTGETTMPADTTTGTDAAPTTDTSSPNQIVADFVAKVRSSFRMTATETSLGMSYEFKVKLLISSIAESSPAEAKLDSAGLDYLQEQLGTSAAA